MVAAATIGSSVIGGVMQSGAASKAAKAQRYAVDRANAQQQHFFDITQKNLQPFIDTGTLAASKVGRLQGLNGENPTAMLGELQSLPGYQFANQQGLKSTQNSATARGLGTSGAALKGAAAYSTGLANQYYNNLLSGLQDTETIGANAAGGLGTNATATGTAMGQNTIGGGNAAAAGAIAQGNAFSNAVGGIPAGLIARRLFDNNGAGGDSTDYYGLGI